MFQDLNAKADCETVCIRRNAHISRFHPMRWRPLWAHGKGWFPALRPVSN